MRFFFFAGLILISAACSPEDARRNDGDPGSKPIIDMHRHAPWPGEDDEAALADQRITMRQNNIVLAALHLTSQDDVERWLQAAPGLFVAGPMAPCPPVKADLLFCFPESGGWPDKVWLENKLQSGEIGALGELLFNYAGMTPVDPLMDDYWRLAAKYEAAVFVHTNPGPPEGRGPRRHDGCCPDFNPSLGAPSLLRPVLEKYPNLRISLQHGGFSALPPIEGEDLWEETVSLLRDYPNVYLDMTVLNAAWDEETHAAALKRFIGAGFGDRIMFGTDDFPPAPIIARIQSFDFLTEEQRRAILYDNAARFLRLDKETIDAHYER